MNTLETMRPMLEALEFDDNEITKAMGQLEGGKKQRPLSYFMGMNAADNAEHLTDCARALIAYAVGGGNVIEARLMRLGK